MPVIASGGCGTVEHLADALTEGRAAAALAASIFHFGDVRIGEAKARLRAMGIEVRPGPDVNANHKDTKDTKDTKAALRS